MNKGLSTTELDHLIGARNYLDFLNPRNELYREKGMKQNPPSRIEALELMAANPNLIRRPLVVEGKRIWFGFNPEEWNEIGR